MFVESVLRYGLPVNFQGMILLPQKKTQKKLRDSLNQLYTHLDSAGGSGDVRFEFTEHNCFQKKTNFFFTFHVAGDACRIGFWCIRILPICLLQN